MDQLDLFPLLSIEGVESRLEQLRRRLRRMGPTKDQLYRVQGEIAILANLLDRWEHWAMMAERFSHRPATPSAPATSPPPAPSWAIAASNRLPPTRRRGARRSPTWSGS